MLGLGLGFGLGLEGVLRFDRLGWRLPLARLLELELGTPAPRGSMPVAEPEPEWGPSSSR